MEELNDTDLIEALRRRFEAKDRALFDLRMTTRKLEEVNGRLVESERLKTDFLSNIRNEINNPLAAILALAREIAAGAVTDPAECAVLATSIFEEAFSLDFQMRNIICAAEIEAGEVGIAVSHVDVRRLLEELVGSFQPQAAAHGATLSHTWCDERAAAGAPFRTDAAKLQIVVANLVSNAVKFSHEGGAVLVEGLCGEGSLAVGVRDTGIGIDAGDQRIIFERFRQLERGRAKSYAGHGLGLCIVQSLAEQLGGAVELRSARNEGSTFTIRIPEAAPGAEDAVFADAGNEFFFGAEKF